MISNLLLQLVKLYESTSDNCPQVYCVRVHSTCKEWYFLVRLKCLFIIIALAFLSIYRHQQVNLLPSWAFDANTLSLKQPRWVLVIAVQSCARNCPLPLQRVL